MQRPPAPTDPSHSPNDVVFDAIPCLLHAVLLWVTLSNIAAASPSLLLTRSVGVYQQRAQIHMNHNHPTRQRIKVGVLYGIMPAAGLTMYHTGAMQVCPLFYGHSFWRSQALEHTLAKLHHPSRPLVTLASTTARSGAAP